VAAPDSVRDPLPVMVTEDMGAGVFVDAFPASPTPSPTVSSTSSNSPTPSSTPSNSPTPSPTPSNSPTPSLTASSTPSVTASPSASPAPDQSLIGRSPQCYGVGSAVRAVEFFEDKLFVGGEFSTLCDPSILADHIAQWDGYTWSRVLHPGVGRGVSGNVNAMKVWNNKLYIAGDFSTLEDTTTFMYYIASFTSATGYSALTYSGGAVGINGPVLALEVFNGQLYLGGMFLSMTDNVNTPVNYVASWNGTAMAALPVGNSVGVNNYVRALCSFGGKLWVAGDFTRLGDQTTANYIASWDGSTWGTLPTTVNAGIRALASWGGLLFATGNFAFTGGGTRVNYVAALDPGSATWSTLSARGSASSVGLGFPGKALASFNGNLYVGGSFSTLGDGSGASYMARWNGTELTSVSFGAYTGTNGEVFAMSDLNGTLHFGGAFTRFSPTSPLVGFVGRFPKP
jgi:hypothetical protein